MTDLDLALRAELEALVPVPRLAPDWRDVVERARPPLHRSPLVLVFAAALVVLGTAAGVTAALGGFDAWLTGEPGTPAPKSEQQRFSASNGRSWAAFPRDTNLRQLIRTDVGGKTYVLYGFRSGNSLCLKLKAVSLGHSTEPSCGPASTLARASAPILVVAGNTGFADRHAHPTALVSFGIAADGVSRVDIHAVDGTHRAVLGGNTYLFVENEPNTGNRVLAVSAVAADGRRTTVPLATTFGPSGIALQTESDRAPTGPAHVQARIARPAIGWFVRHEPRGVALDNARLTRQQRGFIAAHAPGFTRLVKPDPLSNIVVGLTGDLCLFVLAPWPSESCGTAFPSGPLEITLNGSSDQFFAVAGAAADGIRRVTIFLADGQRQEAPLQDNLFAALVAGTEFPIRVVAYDQHNRVVGMQTFRSRLLGLQVPAGATRSLRLARRVRGPDGAVATVRIGRPVDRLRCWRVELSTGQAPHGCMQLVPTGPWTAVDLVQPAGRDLFVIGHARAPVVRVQLEFANGDVVRTRPVEGLFVLAIPRAHLSPTRQLAYAVGYSTEGWRIQKQAVLFRTAS